MAVNIGPWKPPGGSEVEMAAVVACLRQGMAAAQPPQQKAAVTARALLEDWFKVPKTAALIAKAVTGQVEGILIFRAEGGFVRIVYVSALQHRKGLGSQLLGSLKQLCGSKGIKELRVAYSAKDERQKAFFTKKHGFADQGAAGEVAPGFPQTEAKLAVAAGAPA